MNHEEIAEVTGWRKSANAPSLTPLVARDLDRRISSTPGDWFFFWPPKSPPHIDEIEEV
jgi:hypothetical protein